LLAVFKLAEVGPVEVLELRRLGLLGLVNELAMKPYRGSTRPRRALALSGLLSFLLIKRAAM
jgi:hypothetical protein